MGLWAGRLAAEAAAVPSCVRRGAQGPSAEVAGGPWGPPCVQRGARGVAAAQGEVLRSSWHLRAEPPVMFSQTRPHTNSGLLTVLCMQM